ncbi:MAG TPA: hypothetical protein VFX59_11330 [Polyangiales bacterium]|nr:hypothetical protein [Polyangiales bacterium]
MLAFAVLASACIRAQLMPPRGGSPTFKNKDVGAKSSDEVGVYVHLCEACTRPYAGQSRRAQELLVQTCGGDFELVDEGASFGSDSCSASLSRFGRYYCWNARCAASPEHPAGP